jgi:hypothetical protein
MMILSNLESEKPTIQEAIASFYKQNNFGDDGGASKKWVWIKFGLFSFPIPNIESRSQNVYLHDVSHIVTGNDTSWKGESAVSAWEIASGGWGKLYFPWLLTLWAMGLGVAFYPSTTVNAFKNGLTMRNAFTSGISKEQLLQKPVSGLKTLLSNQPSTNKSMTAWFIISFFIFTLPLILSILLLLLLFK